MPFVSKYLISKHLFGKDCVLPLFFIPSRFSWDQMDLWAWPSFTFPVDLEGFLSHQVSVQSTISFSDLERKKKEKKKGKKAQVYKQDVIPPLLRLLTFMTALVPAATYICVLWQYWSCLKNKWMFRILFFCYKKSDLDQISAYFWATCKSAAAPEAADHSGWDCCSSAGCESSLCRLTQLRAVCRAWFASMALS